MGRGEKVIILGDPAVPPDEAYQRMAAFGGRAQRLPRARGPVSAAAARTLVPQDNLAGLILLWVMT